MPKVAQSAIEYLMIIALTLGLIVPTAYLFFRFSSESNVQIVDSQITQIGRSIIDTAQSVYFSGEGSKIILEVNMPKNVDDIYILANRELVFETTSEIGQSESVFFSSANIPITEGSGDLSSVAGSGLKRIRIQAIDDNGVAKVLIEKV
ncbi:MAG: hypothetical protein IH934_08125 [Nanoarchaeota archaeon]|nr:hypothetical protein [Nanoarchaeota archaeon]